MTAVVALALALAALTGVLAASVRLHVWRVSHQRLAWSVLDTAARLASVAFQLEQALARLRQEARVSAVLGDIALAQDLDEVLNRVAAAAASATGARAAVARAVADDGTLVVPFDKDTVHHAPKVKTDVAMTHEIKERFVSYYGVSAN